MTSAIGPKTRVLSFSGILTTTGLIMPVRQICNAARAKGVITVSGWTVTVIQGARSTPLFTLQHGRYPDPIDSRAVVQSVITNVIRNGSTSSYSYGLLVNAAPQQAWPVSVVSD